MLSASALVRRFDDRVAVDGLSFEVRRGEVFGLLGPNGAGKTTTLRMLGGLIAPTSGRLEIDGVQLDRRTAGSLRARIGFLTETPGLWEQLTSSQNLAVYAELFGVADPGAAVARTLQRFDLWDRRDDRAAQLSKGMKQRLALARALLHEPDLVLLDEPTANLDPHSARDVRELLRDLRHAGRAVVVSTHNLDEVERLADRVALVNTRLIAIGSPAALRREVFAPRLRVRLSGGVAPPALVPAATAAGALDVQTGPAELSMSLADPERSTPAIVTSLVQAGAQIREVVEESPRLEDVYLRLLGEPRP